MSTHARQPAAASQAGPSPSVAPAGTKIPAVDSCTMHAWYRCVRSGSATLHCTWPACLALAVLVGGRQLGCGGRRLGAERAHGGVGDVLGLQGGLRLAEG